MKTKDLLIQQVTNELESAYLYLYIKNYFDDLGLSGYANYYHVQALEEVDHAMKIYDYLHDINESVLFSNIIASSIQFNSIREALIEALKAERKVSKQIKLIFEYSMKDGDIASNSFIKWFIDEQIEEEANAQRMIDEYDLYKNNIYELNEKYGGRKYEVLSV